MISFKKSISVISRKLVQEVVDVDSHFICITKKSQLFGAETELVVELSTLIRRLNPHVSHFEHASLHTFNLDAFLPTIQG